MNFRKTSRNNEPRIPRKKAITAEDRGMKRRNIPIVPKMSIAVMKLSKSFMLYIIIIIIIKCAVP